MFNETFKMKKDKSGGNLTLSAAEHEMLKEVLHEERKW